MIAHAMFWSSSIYVIFKLFAVYGLICHAVGDLFGCDRDDWNTKRKHCIVLAIIYNNMIQNINLWRTISPERIPLSMQGQVVSATIITRLVCGMSWTEKGRLHPSPQSSNIPVIGSLRPFWWSLFLLKALPFSSYNVTCLSHGFGVVLLIYVICSKGIGPPSLIENSSISGSTCKCNKRKLGILYLFCPYC